MDSELPTIRSLFHSLLDKHLRVDEAAAVLQDWSDRQRGCPQRNWQHLPEANKELYKLLVYQVACTLVGEPEPADIAHRMDSAIAAAQETVLAGKELILG